MGVVNILGLNLGHDGSAAVVLNGKLVVAATQEKFTKVKKDSGISADLINHVLDEAGISLEQIDAIALAEYYKENSGGIFDIYDSKGKINNTREEILDGNYSIFPGELLGVRIPVYVVSHHMAHAASAFYTSNLEEALCITLDSSGGSIDGNSSISIGRGTQLEYKECPGLMVGTAYSVFTENLELGPPYIKAGSTMGLAAYASPSKSIVKNIKKHVEESYNVKDYFGHYGKLWYQSYSGSHEKPYESFEGRQAAADVQYVFENAVMDMITKAKKKYKIDNLCLSGGSFLNCNVNSIIRDSKLFKNIYHFPACGDDGLCVGAALYISHHEFEQARVAYEEKDVAYLGKKYPTVAPPYKKVAKILSRGGIVAWFMGSSEYGPRALGHRSLLADPRNFHNREIINFSIKKREWFRPFAPSVLEEHAGEWFEPGSPSPFMLYTQKVKRPQEVPAITHIDNTARIQTVNEEFNPEYYKLIKEFYKITGVPMILNTSLNGNGQPILETEEDALDFFEKNKEVDALVLNGKLLTRKN